MHGIPVTHRVVSRLGRKVREVSGKKILRVRALAMFAKVPRPGAVKTRLVPPLTYDEDAALARAFIEDTSTALVAAALTSGAEPVAFYALRDGKAEMRALLADGIRQYAQSGSDLGERLTAAYRQLAEAGLETVCFVGADSPTLPRDCILDAFAALHAGSDVVVGPAADGGCYLIGLRAGHIGVFTGIDWSTARVFAQMSERTAALGLALTVLREWYDVDDAVSLWRLRDELLAANRGIEHENEAPRTRAMLSSLARNPP